MKNKPGYDAAYRKNRYHTDPDFRQRTIDAATKSRKANPEKTRATAKAWYERNKLRRISQRYGISEEELNSMLKTQNNICLICSREMVQLVVDHDHQTGAVRGLLCYACNTALGLFQDNSEILKSAIAYLAIWQVAV